MPPTFVDKSWTFERLFQEEAAPVTKMDPVFSTRDKEEDHHLIGLNFLNEIDRIEKMIENQQKNGSNSMLLPMLQKHLDNAMELYAYFLKHDQHRAQSPPGH